MKIVKYGLKIYALCNSAKFHTTNLQIYCVKQPDRLYRLNNKATDVVKRVFEPIYGTGRNITGDNRFVDINLVTDLKTNKLSKNIISKQIVR